MTHDQPAEHIHESPVPVAPHHPPHEGERERMDFLVPATIMLSGVMIAGSIFYAMLRLDARLSGAYANQDIPSAGAENPPGAPADALKIAGRDVILGNPDAPLSLIEYGDYQCPFCARFHSEVAVPLRNDYIKPGKVKMVFRNFQFLGPESLAAGEAAECAKDQNKFWAYHDALYAAEGQDGREHNGNLNRDLFIRLASNLGMDITSFSSCIDSHKYQKNVQEETAAAQVVGVNSTPTTFVGDQKVTGALPYAQFKTLIDSKLNQ